MQQPKSLVFQRTCEAWDDQNRIFRMTLLYYTDRSIYEDSVKPDGTRSEMVLYGEWTWDDQMRQVWVTRTSYSTWWPCEEATLAYTRLIASTIVE